MYVYHTSWYYCPQIYWLQTVKYDIFPGIFTGILLHLYVL